MTETFRIPLTKIVWDFQVERMGFISRYGSGGGFYWKQTVNQSKHKTFPYPVKRIDKRVYDIALRISKSLE